MRVVKDLYDNVLKAGDFVCFIANPNANWRQTKVITRKQISEVISTEKEDWLVLIDYKTRVSPTRVVKCY